MLTLPSVSSETLRSVHRRFASGNDERHRVAQLVIAEQGHLAFEWGVVELVLGLADVDPDPIITAKTVTFLALRQECERNGRTLPTVDGAAYVRMAIEMSRLGYPLWTARMRRRYVREQVALFNYLPMFGKEGRVADAEIAVLQTLRILEKSA